MSDPIYLADDRTVETAKRNERRDAAANRARILAMARALFAEQGAAAVNMADIAQAAEVGKGTLYRRFANKAELCAALLDDQLTTFQNAVLDTLQDMTVKKVPKLEQLRQFLDALVHFTEIHVPLLCEMQREGVYGGSETTAPHFIWQQLTVNGLLQAAISAGEIRPDADTALLADAILAPLTAQYFRFLREHRGFSPQRISEGLYSLIAHLATSR